MRALIVILVLVVATPARADELPINWFGGPVFGITWERHTGRAKAEHGPYGEREVFLGLEGGPGVLADRLNLGVSNRGGELFVYGEVDGWAGLGVTLGAGYGLESGLHPIAGGWEAIAVPLSDGGCDDPSLIRMLSIAVGVRWTGVLEAYITPKIGVMPDPCF